jgi:hypothetical protein
MERGLTELNGLRGGILQIYRQLTTGTTTIDGTVSVDNGGDTITIDGVTYSLTLVANKDGTTINPTSDEDLFLAVTQTNDLLERVVFLLESIAER